jgi:hypothetical protein
MHLLKPGLVKVNGDSAAGQILFTESTLFALRSCDDAAMAGGLLGGLIGTLIGGLIDSRRAKSAPPEHLTHPDIVALDERTRKALLTTKLLCSIPLSGTFTVRQSGYGLTFTAKDYPEVLYKGLIHKKRVLAYLRERGISVLT